MEGWKEMNLIIFLITGIPNWVEGWRDRKGQQKKKKVRDSIVLAVVGLIMTGVAYLLRMNWIAVPLLLLMWRVTCFDYIAHFFLKRYHKGHEDINIWKFTGKTTYFWDQWIAKIPWGLRLIARLVIFAISLVSMLLS
jgi:hypothetical protein